MIYNKNWCIGLNEDPAEIYPQAEGYFYVQDMDCFDLKALKVGFTITPCKREKIQNRDSIYHHKLSMVVGFNTKKEARLFESKVKKEFDRFYEDNNTVRVGHTETMSYDLRDEIMEYVVSNVPEDMIFLNNQGN